MPAAAPAPPSVVPEAPSVPAPASTSASVAPPGAVSGGAGSLLPESVTAAGLGSDLPGAVQRRRSPVLAWVAVGGGALIVGLTLGRFLFGGEAAAPAAPASVAAPAAQPPLPDLPAPPPEAVEAEEADAPSESVGVKARVATRAPQVSNRATAAPTAPPESKLTGGLRALGSGLGPNAGPRVDGGASTGASGGGELSSAQVQATVARYTGSVKRSCWQPALDTRTKDAPMSARVNVTLDIAPNGTVKNVSTSPDPRGYPGLSSCIAGRVRTWQFPPSGGETTITVPFVFAGQ